jgi:hypothetical protein
MFFIFTIGISYVMDPSVGNCTVQPIDGTGFDAKFVDGTDLNYPYQRDCTLLQKR